MHKPTQVALSFKGVGKYFLTQDWWGTAGAGWGLFYSDGAIVPGDNAPRLLETALLPLRRTVISLEGMPEETAALHRG